MAVRPKNGQRGGTLNGSATYIGGVILKFGPPIVAIAISGLTAAMWRMGSEIVINGERIEHLKEKVVKMEGLIDGSSGWRASVTGSLENNVLLLQNLSRQVEQVREKEEHYHGK